MKVDFRKIEVMNIDGTTTVSDLSKGIGNTIFKLAVPREDMLLGKEIFNDGEIEVNEARATIIKKYLMSGNIFAYIREAIIPLLDNVLNSKEQIEPIKK